VHQEKELQDMTPFGHSLSTKILPEPGLVTDSARYSLGIWDANDKSMRLASRSGYRVFVCDNMAFHGDYTPETMFPN